MTSEAHLSEQMSNTPRFLGRIGYDYFQSSTKEEGTAHQAIPSDTKGSGGPEA